RFKAEVDAIERAVPQSSDTDLALRLMKLIASAHVGHTTIRLGPGAPQLHHLPITFAWYSDGLGVTAASEPYRAALGLRVTKLGTLAPEAFEAAVAPYISYELDEWLHQLSPGSMTTVEIVQTIGQLEADHLNVMLARADGTTFTLPVKVPDAQAPAAALI